MKNKKFNLMTLIPVVSGILALAVDFIIQPKLDAQAEEEMKAENQKYIDSEIERRMAER